MKILVVSPLAEPAHARQIPAALAKHANVEVSVVAPEKSATEAAYEASGWRRLDAGAQVNGFRLIPAALRNPANGAEGFAGDALERVMREMQPEVIQTWGGAPDNHVAQLVRLKRRLCPRAKVVQYGFNNLPIRWRLRTTLKWRWLWRQMAAGIEANSEGITVMREAGFRKPLERIFWGIDTDEFRPMERAGLRERLGIQGEHIVGYVGRFVVEKGLRVLLEALKELPASVHALFIGAGPMQMELETAAAQREWKGRLHVLPTVAPEKLAAYMNCCDAVALASLSTPHWKEQYGRVIGEAMACGAVVVGSDSGAIPEVIGEAGLVAREGDARALGQALGRAVFDASLRERLIAAGLARAEKELSIRAMSGRLMEFYGRLLRG